MPLVVPGINSNSSKSKSADKDEWLKKLVGKKISESTSDANTFAKKDLPDIHRILQPGYAMTLDHRPQRLNIFLDEHDVVKDVDFF